MRDPESRLFKLSEKLDQYKFKIFQLDQDVERLIEYRELLEKKITNVQNPEEEVPEGFIEPKQFEVPKLSALDEYQSRHPMEIEILEKKKQKKI
jgi:hypothetical protein